jgi:hypothetical protein
MSEQPMEERIDQALQQQPEVLVPADFAARVRRQLPAVHPARGRLGVGRTVGALALVALIGALCWLAPGARPDFSSLRFDLELVVLAEMAAVGWWVGKGSSIRG